MGNSWNHKSYSHDQFTSFRFASVGDLPAHQLAGVANPFLLIRRNSDPPFASLNPAGVLTISNPSPDLSRFHRDGVPGCSPSRARSFPSLRSVVAPYSSRRRPFLSVKDKVLKANHTDNRMNKNEKTLLISLNLYFCFGAMLGKEHTRLSFIIKITPTKSFFHFSLLSLSQVPVGK